MVFMKCNKARWRYRSRRGSIALEAVITAPIFLVMMAAILHLLLCIRSETLLMQAVDQVTTELGVIAPLAAEGLDLASGLLGGILQTDIASKKDSQTAETVSKAAGAVGAVMDFTGVEVEDILSTLLLGEVVRDRILAYYGSYEDYLSPDTISDLSVYLDLDNENKRLQITAYYKRNSLFGVFEREIVSSVALYERLDLQLPGTETQKEDGKVWELGNFERGRFLLSKFGGNLPDTYPVITKWENGSASMLKSMDLTSPTYGGSKQTEQKIRQYIRDLANFEGTDKPWGKDKVFIEKGSIHSKELFLIIPENTPSEAYSALESMKREAAEKGITMRWETYEVSHKYEDKAEDTSTEEFVG